MCSPRVAERIFGFVHVAVAWRHWGAVSCDWRSLFCVRARKLFVSHWYYFTSCWMLLDGLSSWWWGERSASSFRSVSEQAIWSTRMKEKDFRHSVRWFSTGHSGSRSPGLWFRRLQSRGSQMVLSAELETDITLSLPSPDRFSASSQGWEACAAVSSIPIKAQTLQLSDSEELDVVSVNARDTEVSPPQSRAYEEFVEVVTRAVNWPAER